MASLVGMVPANSVMAMSSMSTRDVLLPSCTVTESPNEIQALAYCLYNSSVMVVHLENPKQENVSILILNSRNEVIFKENLGKPDKYIGKYNLHELPNDNYTFFVQSNGYTYSKPFVLQTETTRIIKVDVNE